MGKSSSHKTARVKPKVCVAKLEVLKKVKPLMWVEAQVKRHPRSCIEITVKARSQFKERNTATNVEIELHVAADAINLDVCTSMGSASYAQENDALVWKIKTFPRRHGWQQLRANPNLITSI